VARVPGKLRMFTFYSPDMYKRLVFLTVILLSCGKQGKQDEGQKEFVFQKFTDNSSAEVLNLDKMYPGSNYILFIGKGTTVYNVHSAAETVPYDYFYQPDETDAADTTIKHVALKVLIDTANTVKMPFWPEIPDGLQIGEYNQWKERNKRYVAAYPVYIWNSTRQITSIPVNGTMTEMIQEARDEKGVWKPIEYRIGDPGGIMIDADPWQYILQPDYYVITSVYKYTGDFKTDLRIKFKRGDKIFYSQSFSGRINKKQFELPPFFSKPEYSFLDGE